MLQRILMLGILGAALALAQGGEGGMGGMSGGGGGRSGGRGMDNVPQGSFGPVNKTDRITDMLKLSKDQRKTLKQIFDDAQKEATPVSAQIAKARGAIGEAIAAGKGQDAVAKAVNDEAALESTMTVIELKAFAKFALGLEPDQQPRAGMLFQMMRGMFSGKNWNSE
ncbi:MAG: periplasmic heavy metal sensor [Acidobacteriota bacterium]|nr:periplasmic heavy metal sensor [Acidobacteriota bacterium]